MGCIVCGLGGWVGGRRWVRVSVYGRWTSDSAAQQLVDLCHRFICHASFTAAGLRHPPPAVISIPHSWLTSTSSTQTSVTVDGSQIYFLLANINRSLRQAGSEYSVPVALGSHPLLCITVCRSIAAAATGEAMTTQEQSSRSSRCCCC